MTPEQAENIDFAARKIEADKHMANYSPVNQRKVILAGYKAVIDAVTEEVQEQETIKFVHKYLSIQDDKTKGCN